MDGDESMLGEKENEERKNFIQGENENYPIQKLLEEQEEDSAQEDPENWIVVPPKVSPKPKDSSTDGSTDSLIPTSSVPTVPIRKNIIYNFTGNAFYLINALSRFKAIMGDDFPLPPEPRKEIIDFVRSLVPVHRCTNETLLCVIRDSGFRSKQNLEEIHGGGRDSIEMMLKTDPAFDKLVVKYNLQKNEDTKKIIKIALIIYDNNIKMITNKIEKDIKKSFEFEDPKPFANELIVLVNKKRDVISKCTKGGFKLRQDTKLGTSDCVFTTLGDNRHIGHKKCELPVVVIFKAEIMFQPSFTMSPCAATSILSSNNFYYRPWSLLGVPTDSRWFLSNIIKSKIPTKKVEFDLLIKLVLEEDNIKEVYQKYSTEQECVTLYHRSVLHPTVNGWEEIFAAELEAQALLYYIRESTKKGEPAPKKPIEVKEVFDWYANINPHGTIEGHLPSYVPGNYIDKVLLPQEDWEDSQNQFLGKGEYLVDKDRKWIEIINLLNTKRYDKRNRHYPVPVPDRPPRHGDEKLPRKMYSKGFSFKLEHNRGKDVFLPLSFPSMEECWVQFDAKGQHIRLAFTDQLRCTRNSHRKVYFVGLGIIQNTVSYLKTHNDEETRDSVIEIKKSDNEMAMASPCEFKKFWVWIKMGLIEVGMGNVKENMFMRYYDPQPIVGIKYLSVSNWKTPVEFENFIFGTNPPPPPPPQSDKGKERQ